MFPSSKKIVPIIILSTLAMPSLTHAALLDQVNQAFETVHGRLPNFTEWEYWAQRVQKGQKKTYDALFGAIGYEKEHGGDGIGKVLASIAASPPATTFKTDKVLYPSTINPNFLPDGTLVRSPASPNVYYLKDGKRSWVLPALLDRWLGENHFYKTDIITLISDSDLKRYVQTSSVNFLYIGKVLKAPNGQQYFIDDKLRKRPISAAVRTALKFPGKNLYSTTSEHLKEFATGPAITRSDVQPGGMVVYDGPYHGGRIWRIEEGANGKPVKRLFLSDYLYEAYGYPDESQRVAVNATELARYERSTNISKYPDGWVVGLNANSYVVQKETLRLIGSQELFNAMGYKTKYILKVFPEFLKTYAHGQPIGAFKAIVVPSIKAKAQPVAAPSAASSLTKVRPAIRTIIAQINDIALPVFDKQLSASENQFWVDYVYNGEVQTKEDLIASMKKAKSTGKLPARTSRTAVLDAEVLKNKWFPYLFYFVHQKEANDQDKAYWYGRIESGDRNTIEKLGGTLQWLKDTSGQTSK